MRKLFALLSLLVVFSMALSACGGQATTAPAPTAKPADTKVVEPTATQPPASMMPAAGSGPDDGWDGDTFKSKDPTTFYDVGIGEPEVIDPALAYETAGAGVIFNVYEGLVFYKGESVSEFEPLLAESYTISADGMTYTFTMRSGVKFHDGADLTASDVAYSFARGILQGGGSSPQWMMISPVAGLDYHDISDLVDAALADDPEGMKAADPATLKAACETITGAIVADDAAGTVTITLAQPFAPYLAIIAQSWGSVMDKDWTVANGGWDGSCDTWQNYYGMLSENDPFNDKMNGTGPFKFDHWTKGEELVLVRNDAYWREPAKLERVVKKFVAEFGTQYSMLQAGDADFIDAGPNEWTQMDDLGVGVVCNWNAAEVKYECSETDSPDGMLLKTLGRPGNTRTDVFFNFNIANPDDNPYIGSGKLDGNGTPADFFADVHIRRAFNYCFDWDTYTKDIFRGEATQAIGLPLEGMAGYEPDGPKYANDPAKCEEEFKLADLDKDGIPAGDDPEGDVWTTGFRMQIAYNQGNTTRQTVSEILAGGLAAVNENFTIETLGLPWPAFLRARRARQLPIFVLGWLEDYHDSHNWYFPYLIGDFGAYLRMPDDLVAQFTELVNAGASEIDPVKRAEIYSQLNQLVYDNTPFILLATATSHGYTPRYVRGVVRNPIFPDTWYYTIYKQ